MDVPHRPRPWPRRNRVLSAVSLALALLTGLFTFAFVSPAGAVADDTCYVPGVEAVKEHRFKVRAELHGEKEIKEIKDWTFGGSQGTVQVNGHTIPGQWSQSSGWNPIPEVIINAVWGSGGIPGNVLGQGSVSLSVYGGPNVSVQYDAHKVETDEGFTDWSDWSEWSTTDPGPETDLRKVQERTRPGTGLDEQPFPCPEASATPGTCEAPGVITVTESEHYTSSIVGHVVTFTAVSPAVFGPAVRTELSFPEVAQLQGEQCDDAPPPPPPPPPPTTPTTGVTTTTEVTTTTVPADVGGITDEDTLSEGAGAGQLPRTGAGVGGLLLVAGLLTGLGATLRTASRRLH